MKMSSEVSYTVLLSEHYTVFKIFMFKKTYILNLGNTGTFKVMFTYVKSTFPVCPWLQTSITTPTLLI